jgi:hypothetical protein
MLNILFCFSAYFAFTLAFLPSNTLFISKISKHSTSASTSTPLLKTRLLSKESEDLEETTKKFGLEVGLFKAVTNKDDSQKVRPQDLLAKYGVAYLITSVTFAIISYALCYVLVANGIDVASILEKVGITATATASNAGTAGIAYAIHKAASPIRFPPTVALTPVVAGLIGKKTDDNASTKPK